MLSYTRPRLVLTTSNHVHFVRDETWTKLFWCTNCDGCLLACCSWRCTSGGRSWSSTRTVAFPARLAALDADVAVIASGLAAILPRVLCANLVHAMIRGEDRQNKHSSNWPDGTVYLHRLHPLGA